MDVSVTELLLSLIAVFAGWVFLAPRVKEWLSQRSRFNQLIGKLPGPKTMTLIGDVYCFVVNPQNMMMTLIGDIQKNCGQIFRLWVGPFKATVHVSSWKYVEEIFNSNVHIEKNFIYSFLHSWLGTGLLTSTGSKWHSRRKLLTPSFHRSVLDSFQEVFMDKTDKLLKILDSKCKESDAFDIAPLIWQCSLDIICETAMGTKMDIQECVSKEDASYLRSLSCVAETTVLRFLRPWLHPQLIFNLTSTGREFNKSVKIMHAFSNKVIQSRKKEYLQSLEKSAEERIQENDDFGMKKRRKAFIDTLIEAAYAEGQNKTPVLSDKDIREEVDTFMFEGHDTTASGISWTLYLLGRHPEIQEEVVKEIHEVLGNEKAISTQKLTELRFLDRCIRESQRLYPSVPMIGRVLRTETQLGEYVIPPNTDVLIHIYYLHRDKEIFPDPDKFNPDNFLPEACDKRPAYAFVPFSAGSRNCIGQKFAMQETKTVLASVLQAFRIESIDPPESLVLLPELILRSEEGIRVRLHPR